MRKEKGEMIKKYKMINDKRNEMINDNLMNKE